MHGSPAHSRQRPMTITTMWTACTVLQLSESIGNPWGQLTATINYRLALTAQPLCSSASSDSHSPPPALEFSVAPPPSLQLTFTNVIGSDCVNALCIHNCFSFLPLFLWQRHLWGKNVYFRLFHFVCLSCWFSLFCYWKKLGLTPEYINVLKYAHLHVFFK